MDCKGKICDYYREYYNVIRVHGAYMPDFNVPTNKHCAHPKVFTPKSNVYDNGIGVGILRTCPGFKRMKKW